MICIYMNLRGVAVLGLDSHPDHKKGPDYAPPTKDFKIRRCKRHNFFFNYGKKLRGLRGQEICFRESTNQRLDEEKDEF